MWTSGPGLEGKGDTMTRSLLFAGRKLLRALLLLVGVSLAAFLLLCASPLDPLQTNVGQVALGSMSQEQVAQLEAYWGVDQPPVERYLGWLGGVVHGDFGTSLLYRQPVLTVIGQRLASSLWLLLAAWVISGVLGLVLGVTAGAFRGRWPDKLIRGYCLVISSTPAFWLALLFLLIFSVWLGWLPIGLSVPIGVEEEAVTLADRLQHAVLPTLTLSVTGVSNIALHTREKLVDVLGSDYILMARARGESSRSIILRHGLRNVALPALTLQFGSISEIIGGSVLVEQVFSYPGLGQAAVTAGLGSDLPLLLGITVITSALVFGGNLLVDLLYGVIDPRMKKGERRS
jgi:ABC-type dipeptide/oligopeptide/nickel transport system permease component